MSLAPKFFKDVEGFQWDEGNSQKNWVRHKVIQVEAEQVFFNRPLVVTSLVREDLREIRYFALGKTDAERLLTIVFTLRDRLIRVISARPMSRPERKAYTSAKTS